MVYDNEQFKKHLHQYNWAVFTDVSIESMKNAYDRIYLANSNMYKNYLDPKLFIYKENNIKIGSENTKTELNKEIPKPNNLKSYYDSLFPKIRVLFYLF